MNIPRSEHPNPQFERKDWLNLNGKWEFEIDKSISGIDRKLYNSKKLSGEIIVPFCPESELSGVGDTDFLNAVWYRKTITINNKDKRIILHIGACDYKTILYINGNKVGTHKGGYTSFSFEITDFVEIGDNNVVIYALDDTRSGNQPSGKQSDRYYSYGCFYTRTTGIWQTVWLEYVPFNYIKNVKYYPDVNNGKVDIKADLCGDGEFEVKVSYEGKVVGEGKVKSNGGKANLSVALSEIHLWEPGHGRLYDIKLTFGEDIVNSYFGLRNVAIDGYKFLINGKSVFMRTVLDQGFYPDGIYTAPSDQALKNDIQISLDAGFNGARLHEKIFEPRFLYHCDKMGYLVWGEHANWGFDHTDISKLNIFMDEWIESVNRDFNHPAIIGWCPFNETWDIDGVHQSDDMIKAIYDITKQMDETRPCIDTSGSCHVKSDMFDFHDYAQNPEQFEKLIRPLCDEGIPADQLAKNPAYKHRHKYTGGPIFVSEYGGIKWDVENTNKDSWGYGNGPKTEEEFIGRYKDLTHAIMKEEKICGFCYTQIYDVEQEQNGLYTYSRKPKFDMNIFKEINSVKAKIEE